ncbi:MAG: hypothetical protein M1819_006069 [Sarea resinae]|nr:MAG: hypothetical protein M1819_006069 [Sarea resinae]
MGMMGTAARSNDRDTDNDPGGVDGGDGGRGRGCGYVDDGAVVVSERSELSELGALWVVLKGGGRELEENNEGEQEQEQEQEQEEKQEEEKEIKADRADEGESSENRNDASKELNMAADPKSTQAPATAPAPTTIPKRALRRYISRLPIPIAIPSPMRSRAIKLPLTSSTTSSYSSPSSRQKQKQRQRHTPDSPPWYSPTKSRGRIPESSNRPPRHTSEHSSFSPSPSSSSSSSPTTDSSPSRIPLLSRVRSLTPVLPPKKNPYLSRLPLPLPLSLPRRLPRGSNHNPSNIGLKASMPCSRDYLSKLAQSRAGADADTSFGFRTMPNARFRRVGISAVRDGDGDGVGVVRTPPGTPYTPSTSPEGSRVDSAGGGCKRDVSIGGGGGGVMAPPRTHRPRPVPGMSCEMPLQWCRRGSWWRGESAAEIAAWVRGVMAE